MINWWPLIAAIWAANALLYAVRCNSKEYRISCLSGRFYCGGYIT